MVSVAGSNRTQSPSVHGALGKTHWSNDSSMLRNIVVDGGRNYVIVCLLLLSKKTLTKTKTSWGRKYLFGLQTTIHHSRQEPRSSNCNWDHEETLLTEAPDWGCSAHSGLSSSLQPLIKKMTPTDLFTGQSDGGMVSLKFTASQITLVRVGLTKINRHTIQTLRTHLQTDMIPEKM